LDVLPAIVLLQLIDSRKVRVRAASNAYNADVAYKRRQKKYESPRAAQPDEARIISAQGRYLKCLG
jgi:hypothetical protein